MNVSTETISPIWSTVYIIIIITIILLCIVIIILGPLIQDKIRPSYDNWMTVNTSDCIDGQEIITQECKGLCRGESGIIPQTGFRVITRSCNNKESSQGMTLLSRGPCEVSSDGLCIPYPANGNQTLEYICTSEKGCIFRGTILKYGQRTEIRTSCQPNVSGMNICGSWSIQTHKTSPCVYVPQIFLNINCYGIKISGDTIELFELSSLQEGYIVKPMYCIYNEGRDITQKEGYCLNSTLPLSELGSIIFNINDDTHNLYCLSAGRKYYDNFTDNPIYNRILNVPVILKCGHQYMTYSLTEHKIVLSDDPLNTLVFEIGMVPDTRENIFSIKLQSMSWLISSVIIGNYIVSSIPVWFWLTYSKDNELITPLAAQILPSPSSFVPSDEIIPNDSITLKEDVFPFTSSSDEISLFESFSGQPSLYYSQVPFISLSKITPLNPVQTIPGVHFEPGIKAFLNGKGRLKIDQTVIDQVSFIPITVIS